ncbi:guanylate kinase [Candidatus Saccharibacteria bacterium]|nr:guanylate kinase [Candidatus Saccharibacteria bacterium]
MKDKVVKATVCINKLEKIDQFRRLLADYRPSQANIDRLDDVDAVFLVGPSASGRNTLINILVQTGRYRFVVSDTTRHPRENNGVLETNGVEYWFRSEDEFLDGLSKGGYLEAAIIHNQQVSGISFAELFGDADDKRRAIDEIEVGGVDSIRKYTDGGLFIFLLPPSFEIWMQRLKDRGNLEQSEIRRRLESALTEIQHALQHDFYHFVINNEIHEAANAVDELASGRLPDATKQAYGKSHSLALIVQIEQYLA